jgi:arsenite-transporting ATPase
VRVLLFTGKGGVGKTTIAAATALHAARCGIKTLVVSADAAHSLADCLGLPLGPEPVEVPLAVRGDPTGGLFAVQVDARARAERSWRSIQEYLVGVLDAVGVDPVAAEELTVLPGAEELLGLLEVRDLVAAGDHDIVVVDCAPTAEALRLLALPEAFAHYLDQALPVERRVLRAIAAGARAVRPGHDPVVEAAERLRAELDGVRAVLDAPGTSARLVLTPEAVVISEARRLFTALAMYGYPVDGVVANRVVPDDGDDPWRLAWARAQDERLAECEPSFAPLPVLRAPYAAAEPIGPDALAALGAHLYGDPGEDGAHRLLAPPAAGQGLRVERDGGEFVLVLPLPLADRSDVELARLGDDLSLTVAGRRRLISLPSALRRCVVAGAGLRDGALRVRFRPDPALWRSP